MTRSSTMTGEIVARPGQGLALRTAAVVRRGLRDLARDSNWLVKKIFQGSYAIAAVSPGSQVAAYLAEDRRGMRPVVIYETEGHASPIFLSGQEDTNESTEEITAALGWSPNGAILGAGSSAWANRLQIFDVHKRRDLRSLEVGKIAAVSFTWSPSGALFAVASPAEHSLHLWRCVGDEPALAHPPIGTLDVAQCLRRAAQAVEGGAEGEETEAEFSGFGPISVRSDEKALAVALKYAGDWADDSILVVGLPGMSQLAKVHAQGSITDLGWSADGTTVIFCAGGQAFSATSDSPETTALPFTAELCRCHPRLPLCAGYASWLKNSAKGRLFIADLKRMRVIDECAAEGVLDLRWSTDGDRACAITRDGLAFVYERSPR